jgi:hypothetical protein
MFFVRKKRMERVESYSTPPKLYSEQSKATLNGDDGCTTSTMIVQRVVKPDRNTFPRILHIVALEKL